MQAKSIGPRFATELDFELCRRLHRRHGTTYYFATRRFPADVRRRVHALYAFVRIPDEWVDNPGGLSVQDRRERVEDWGNQLVQSQEGHEPAHWAMRAFADVVRESGMPLDEPLQFLSAMAMDLDRTRYETYGDLLAYMRGSAAAVGLMMLTLLGVPESPQVRASAIALGNAMQLTNFLRDVGEDMRRGRLYIPQEDLATFEVSAEEIQLGAITDRWVRLMKFEIARARALYAESDAGLPLLPDEARRAVAMARILYSRILDRIESNRYDVFDRRARTSTIEKLWVAATMRMR